MCNCSNTTLATWGAIGGGLAYLASNMGLLPLRADLAAGLGVGAGILFARSNYNTKERELGKTKLAFSSTY